MPNFLIENFLNPLWENELILESKVRKTRMSAHCDDGGQKPMNFQEFCKMRRPRLDDAMFEQFCLIMGDAEQSLLLHVREALGGGKKIRGCLTMLMSEALGGEFEEVIPRAVAIELIQTASLIHDDFVDQDIVRRNLPATWTLIGARRAVLLGDIIFATAIRTMSAKSQEDGKVVSRAVALVSRGAFQEPLERPKLIHQIESDEFNTGLYEDIIHLKTGVLFGAACQLGAIAARADKKKQEKVTKYGIRIGEAYQIEDDLKEIKRHLHTLEMHPDQMALLTPTILFYKNDAVSWISKILSGGPVRACPEIWEDLCEVSSLMERAIAARLDQACQELDGLGLREKSSELVHSAPSDLIRMFSGS